MKARTKILTIDFEDEEIEDLLNIAALIMWCSREHITLTTSEYILAKKLHDTALMARHKKEEEKE